MAKLWDAQVLRSMMQFPANREKIAYKLIRQLEKIAIDYDFKKVVVSFDSREDILVEIFEKLDYRFIDDVCMEKEFKIFD